MTSKVSSLLTTNASVLLPRETSQPKTFAI
jgi:hypothetical protein